MNRWLGVFSIVLLMSVTGCTRVVEERDAAPKHIPNLSAIPNAKPRLEKLSRTGNPKHYKVFRKQYTVMKSSRGYRAKGYASWYGTKFHGRRTSSGERYDMFAMTGAHRTLPLPTYARVTNVKNGRSIIVKFNDRGPFHNNRLVDLSYTAAAKLGILGNGTGLVEVVSIDPRDHPELLFKKSKNPKKPLKPLKKRSIKSAAKQYRAALPQKKTVR